MLKLNASFSNKVPAEQEYSSKGYSATIEIELPDGLSQEQLQGRIHDTFEMVRTSVENEINATAQALPLGNNAPVSIAYPVNGNNPPTQPVNQNGNTRTQAPSGKQIKYLNDLAREKNIPLAGYLQSFGLTRIEDLNRQQCSQIIDQIRAVKAA